MRTPCARPDKTKELMKVATLSAAALAAGLTTFAANARDDLVSMAAMKPDNTIAEKERSARNETPDLERGLTAEEVFHAAQANKADRRDQRYKPIIERHAALNGVSIQLAHAVVRVESNYRPYSRGKAGEVGLMQIKPATAKLMGYSGSTAGLFDPETNIKYGMKYLGKAQKLGDGSTCGTILKYNAGHAAKRMNPVSRDYCDKVKRHIVESLSWLWSGREYDRGV